MQSYLAQVAARQLASGGAAGISLLELQTIAGNRYYWSDAKLAAPSELAVFDNPVIIRRTAETPNAPPPPNVQFVPWILTPPSFHSFRSTQTATGTVVIQNVTGDTVRRDAAQIFSQFELLGSLFIYRLWLTDCEFATDVVQGTVDEVVIEADGDSITLSLEGFCNWSKIDAPNKDIGVSCGLTFGSIACGSTASTPCQNSYGTCTSVERFDGIVLEWNGAALNYSQYVQPEPLRLVNGRVAV